MAETEDSQETYNISNDFQSSPEGSLSAETYRPIHSLLLCPSQWTALLESPVSLVRQSDIEGSLEEITEDEEMVFGTAEKYSRLNENIRTPCQVSVHVEQDSLSQEEKVKSNTGQPLSLRSEGGVSTELESTSGEVNGSKEAGQATPAHLVPLPVSTASSQGSSEGSCTIGGSGDEGNRGNETPAPSERSSMPSTPISETRLPIHFTHSRNVSETLSLPPFVSSSSSSAYHSRNSSMTSQITSDCFDSDSQFTDIDSCIVTYRNDFHRPISLQEARFKFPEVTAMEVTMHRQWFSDLNMTTPIRVPEHLFVRSPPPLEETLTVTGSEPQRASPNESFEDKHLAAALKSSEWIKREMRRAKQTMIQVKVSSRSRHVVHFNVKAGDMFLWEFATKRKDIAFGLSFEPTEVATQQQDTENEENKLMKMVPILPILRVNTHTHPIIGSHTATQDGVYEILFDNSYSRFFAKELYYRITTKPLIPNEHYLDQ